MITQRLYMLPIMGSAMALGIAPACQRPQNQDADAAGGGFSPDVEIVEACQDEPHRVSDYQLGRWVGTVKIPGSDGSMTVDSTVRSEAILERMPGGCAFIERRVVFRDGRPTTRIHTVRAYDPGAARWYQFLVSSQPVVIRFEGERSETGLRFTAPRSEGEGLVRVTDRAADSAGFDRVIEASDDGGVTWILEDVVEYRRP